MRDSLITTYASKKGYENYKQQYEDHKETKKSTRTRKKQRPSSGSNTS